MGPCINHPETETSYYCMKHQEYRCEKCLRCKDPQLYCKFRSACPIWFMQKGAKDIEGEPESETSDTDAGVSAGSGKSGI